MRNRFTITISDVSGSKSFNVHQIIKKVAFYTILVIIGLLVTGGFSIWFLTSQVQELKLKKEGMKSEYQELLMENEVLAKRILQKSEDLDAISDKVNDIEELIASKSSLFCKILLAKVSFSRKSS